MNARICGTAVNRVPRHDGSERLALEPARVMFLQLKTGYDIDKGPAWIGVVYFNRSWKTAVWHGTTLRRWLGMFDANFYDVEYE